MAGWPLPTAVPGWRAPMSLFFHLVQRTDGVDNQQKERGKADAADIGGNSKQQTQKIADN